MNLIANFPPTFTGVVLVGGASRRMGMDKALIEWEGEPFWQRQLRTLRALPLERVVISSFTKPLWLHSEVDWLSDGSEKQGPLAGILALLESMTTSHLVVLAIDMPKMTSRFLESLMQTVEPGMAVIPSWAGDYEPLAAVYPQESKIIARSFLEQNNPSLQNFIRSLEHSGKVRLRSVNRVEEDLFSNINTPEDQEKLQHGPIL